MRRMNGDDDAQPFLAMPSDERSPTFSPNGRWLAYTSNASGQDEIYVYAFPDTSGGHWQISRGGGTEPLWSRDGRELFYWRRDEVVSVRVETESAFRMVGCEVLFKDDTYYRVPNHTKRRISTVIAVWTSW